MHTAKGVISKLRGKGVVNVFKMQPQAWIACKKRCWSGLLLLTALSWASGKRCNLPRPKAQLDVSKLSPVWYLAFHSQDSIMGEDIKCDVLSNFTTTENGFQFMARNYYYHSFTTQTAVIRREIQPDGNFRTYFHPKDQSTRSPKLSLPFDGSFAFDRHGRLNKVAVKEFLLIVSEENFHLTDYDSFWCRISCSLTKGKWVIWCYATTPNPPYDTILKAIEALVDQGITGKLRGSGCSSTDFSKYDQPTAST